MKSSFGVQLTKEGFERLKKEREELEKKRPAVVERMSVAREQGDLSENAGYHAAKEELTLIDHRVREIREILNFGEIVEDHDASVVGIGNTVVVEGELGKREFRIVGDLEADPAKGRLSRASPIGEALLGKRVGETVEVDVPDGKVRYKVCEIRVS